LKCSRDRMRRLQRQIVEMYGEGCSVKEIAQQTGCTRQTIYRVLRSNNVRLQGLREPSSFKGRRHSEESKQKNRLAHLGKEPGNKFHRVNEGYFEFIDSPEKAYWLGFIMADGCVHERRGTWYFHWTSKDREVLDRFLSDIGATYRVKAMGSGFYHISFANQRFVKHLMSHGVIPNKTFRSEFPDLDQSLISHFARGLFDGDGSMCLLHGRQLCLTFAGGSFALLDRLRRIISGTTGADRKQLYGGGGCYRLVYYGSNAVKVGSWLYQDARRYLSRKRAIFESFLGRC